MYGSEEMLVRQHCDDVFQFDFELMFGITSKSLKEGKRMEIWSDHIGNLNIYKLAMKQ